MRWGQCMPTYAHQFRSKHERLDLCKLENISGQTLACAAAADASFNILHLNILDAESLSISQPVLLFRSVPAPFSPLLLLPWANIKHLGVHTASVCVCLCAHTESVLELRRARVRVCWLLSKPARLRVQHLWVQMLSNDMLMALEGDEHRG